MKSTKKLSMLLAALFLFTGLLVGSCITASAAAQVPKKVRIRPGSTYDSFEMTLSEPGDVIKNIKTSSNDLKAKETAIHISVSSEGETTRNTRAISLYTAKEGKYTVSFDIMGTNNKKKSSKKVTVYAYSDSPVKEVTLDGEHSFGLVSKSSGRLQVVMNSGYKLKKIEIGKYVKKTEDDGKSIDTEMKYKTIKNNAKITLSKVPYEYGHESGSLNPEENEDSYYQSKYYSKSWSTEIAAETHIRITYIDKYTKEEDTTSYYFEKLTI